ncbi:MAG TPA: hypothetical protein VIN40_01105, partial [Candidatus Tyrphobacter sp.]
SFAVSSIALEAGDTLVLCGHTVQGTIDSQHFVESLESGPEQQVLRVRYEPSDDVPAPAPQRRTLLRNLGASLLALLHGGRR